MKINKRWERNQFVLIGEQNSWRLAFELGRQQGGEGPEGDPDFQGTTQKKLTNQKIRDYLLIWQIIHATRHHKSA